MRLLAVEMIGVAQIACLWELNLTVQHPLSGARCVSHGKVATEVGRHQVSISVARNRSDAVSFDGAVANPREGEHGERALCQHDD